MVQESQVKDSDLGFLTRTLWAPPGLHLNAQGSPLPAVRYLHKSSSEDHGVAAADTTALTCSANAVDVRGRHLEAGRANPISSGSPCTVIANLSPA